MNKLGDSLKETEKIITGDRQDNYGNPENSFQLIANYWNIYLIEVQKKVLTEKGFDLDEYSLISLLTPVDVAHMMMLFKTARCSGQKSSRDNYLDIQGYAAIVTDLLLQEDK